MAKRSAGAKVQRPRGDALGLGLDVLRYISDEPRQPGEIAAKFGVSRRTIERILRTAEAHGLDVQVTRRGRGAWYQLRVQGWTSALLPHSPRRPPGPRTPRGR